MNFNTLNQRFVRFYSYYTLLMFFLIFYLGAYIVHTQLSEIFIMLITGIPN
jgi:hypothetical protein